MFYNKIGIYCILKGNTKVDVLDRRKYKLYEKLLKIFFIFTEVNCEIK